MGRDKCYQYLSGFSQKEFTIISHGLVEWGLGCSAPHSHSTPSMVVVLKCSLQLLPCTHIFDTALMETWHLCLLFLNLSQLVNYFNYFNMAVMMLCGFQAGSRKTTKFLPVLLEHSCLEPQGAMGGIQCLDVAIL